MSYLGIYFLAWRFRRVWDKWGSMPWQSQRREVKQHQEEDLAELSGGLPRGEEATLRLSRHPRPEAADGSISAAGGEKPGNDLWRRTSQGSRWQRKPGLGVRVESEHGRQGELFRIMHLLISFPPGSVLVTLLIFKMQAETHASPTSAMTRYQWRQLPLLLQQHHSALASNSTDKPCQHL